MFRQNLKTSGKKIHKVNEIANFIVILTIINFINSIRRVRIILTYENVIVNLPTMIAQYGHHMTITKIDNSNFPYRKFLFFIFQKYCFKI